MADPSKLVPELLAPAGDWECAKAAIENGADAVYFGLADGFNARQRANNISIDALTDFMQMLRQRGVKGYVALNTLIFSRELLEFEKRVRAIIEAGVDAALVQDIGAMRLLRDLCPEFTIHASTQATATSAETIEPLAELGVERVVLARELSMEAIAKIHQQTTMELEAFVHGALCVAYSGQCLTSESLGGRSANRGQCAQACRLPYDIISDGHRIDLAGQRYLLSPQDLAAYELVPQLIEAGVRSLKIEGRLKTPEYVANITQHYRQAIDDAVSGQTVRFTDQQIEEMELSFSRGFSQGWFPGNDHKALVPGMSSAKRGVLLGSITSVAQESVVVRLRTRLRRGDGIVFSGDRYDGHETGGRVFEIFLGSNSVTEAAAHDDARLKFGRDSIDFSKLFSGQQVWKTDDPKLTQSLRRSFSGARPIRKLPLDLSVCASTGKPISISASLPGGIQVVVQSTEVLAEAKKHPLTEAILRTQLDRLGNTAYSLRNLSTAIDGQPMLPLSVLGKLRRELVEALDLTLRQTSPRKVAEGSATCRLRAQAIRLDLDSLPSQEGNREHLNVLCRTLDQLRWVAGQAPSTVYVDFQDIREYREAVSIARDSETELVIATTRIQKPGEMFLFEKIARFEPDAVLVRNLAGLHFFRQAGLPVIADFSLNATNELTVAFLLDRGAQRVTPSYDLNREQLLDLVEHARADRLEIVIHQHMPMFHMEHCVFCSVLSNGTDRTNCGRPCDTHLVQLEDRVGQRHRLTADVGCRNTLFNAQAQSGAEVVRELMTLGVNQFRIELLEETTERQVAELIMLYKRLIAGAIDAEQVWRRLNAANRVGVTRGTLESARDPLAII